MKKKYWRRSSRWRAAFKKASLRHRSRLESLAAWGTPYDTIWRMFYIQSELLKPRLHEITKMVWHHRETGRFPENMGEARRELRWIEIKK